MGFPGDPEGEELSPPLCSHGASRGGRAEFETPDPGRATCGLGEGLRAHRKKALTLKWTLLWRPQTQVLHSLGALVRRARVLLGVRTSLLLRETREQQQQQSPELPPDPHPVSGTVLSMLWVHLTSTYPPVGFLPGFSCTCSKT